MSTATKKDSLTGLLSYGAPYGSERHQLVRVVRASGDEVRVRAPRTINEPNGSQATLVLEDEHGLLPVPVRLGEEGALTRLRLLEVGEEVASRLRSLLAHISDASGVVRTGRPVREERTSQVE